MTKEEQLKIYSAYLPYGLKLIDNINIIRELTHKGYWHRSSEDDTVFVGVDEAIDYNLKPILYDLSYLTKEIEHEGEKFVPMIRLFSDFGYLPNTSHHEHLQVQVYFKLLEWNFNVFNLPEDQFINKATLNK